MWKLGCTCLKIELHETGSDTHTRLYKPGVNTYFCHEILLWLNPAGHDFIWSCFICRTISQQNNRGQCILTFILSSPQVYQPPACFVLDIYVCVCVLPWTAHTAGPPSLDSSGLRSCSVSPWTSHWNTQIDFNSRLKVWRERRVWVLQISFSFPECVEMTLLQFDKNFSLSFKYHYISLCDVMCISSRSTPGCCCPRRVSGGFTKEKRLLQISPPASNSKAACLSLFLASGNSKILSAGVSDSVL